MRGAVTDLAASGPLPDENLANEDEIGRRTRLLDEISIVPPTRMEIDALLDVFPRDDGECFGLSWTLLHIIESGPDWPMWEAMDERAGPWIDLLRLRLHNGGWSRQARTDKQPTDTAVG